MQFALFASSLLFAAATAPTSRAQPVEPSDEVYLQADYLDPIRPVPVDVNVHGVYVRDLDAISDVVERNAHAGLHEKPMTVGRRLSRKHFSFRARHHPRHYDYYDSEEELEDSVEDACLEEDSTATVYTTVTSSFPVTTVYTTITTSSPLPEASLPYQEPADSPSPPEAPISDGIPPPQPSFGAVIRASGSPCGEPNAVADPSPTSGPNGDENWLNCGVDTDEGWTPPPVTLQNLIYRNLSEILETPNSVFEACRPYLWMFETMEAETGVPTIFLASIALQESGCNPEITGGAGEIGMMQITSEKCPQDGSDCYDPMTNIRIGSEYFKMVLDSNEGNLAQTMGEYNGWRRGLTVQQANNYAVCAQHNNLDYLQYVFNGYLQGVSPYELGMGIWHNTC